MKKIGMCIRLNDDKVVEYKRLHAHCSGYIRDLLKKVNIHNYSIFLKEPENILFSYFEYDGGDFEKDMKRMADDKENQKWWELCGPCQKPFENRKKGEWWSVMEKVFYNE